MSLGSLLGVPALPSAHGRTAPSVTGPAPSCLSGWVVLFLLIHKFFSGSMDIRTVMQYP